MISVFFGLSIKIDNNIYNKKEGDCLSFAKTKIEDFPAFGRRLMELAREKNIGSPLQLAEALYENCRDLIEPAQRRNKHGKIVKDRKHDIDAIRRRVQTHFDEENAYLVPSKYLYAYSRLFDCSLDYLYGVVPVRSCNLEIQDICEKMHMEEKAVLNFINEYDPDPEVFAPAKFWSDVLKSDLFSKVPYAWLGYSMEVLKFKDLEKKLAAIKKAEDVATDPMYRATMESRYDSLEKLRPRVRSDCDGAFKILADMLSEYIDMRAEEWVKSKHTDWEQNYYDNELKKIEYLEKVLKEGSEKR